MLAVAAVPDIRMEAVEVAALHRFLGLHRLEQSAAMQQEVPVAAAHKQRAAQEELERTPRAMRGRF
jgi:hypothetical protein